MAQDWSDWWSPVIWADVPHRLEVVVAKGELQVEDAMGAQLAVGVAGVHLCRRTRQSQRHQRNLARRKQRRSGKLHWMFRVRVVQRARRGHCRRRCHRW